MNCPTFWGNPRSLPSRSETRPSRRALARGPRVRPQLQRVAAEREGLEQAPGAGRDHVRAPFLDTSAILLLPVLDLRHQARAGSGPAPRPRGLELLHVLSTFARELWQEGCSPRAAGGRGRPRNHPDRVALGAAQENPDGGGTLAPIGAFNLELARPVRRELPPPQEYSPRRPPIYPPPLPLFSFRSPVHLLNLRLQFCGSSPSLLPPTLFFGFPQGLLPDL